MARSTEGLTERIADAVPGWGARLSYGERQTVDGVELVPVAFVAFGFGAGELRADGEAQEAGSGGGGGGTSIPLGAYIGGRDGLRFRPNPVVLLALGVSAIGALGVSISAIVGASRRRR